MNDTKTDRGDDIEPIVTSDETGDPKVDKEVEGKTDGESKKTEDEKSGKDVKESKDPKAQLTIPKAVFDERLAKAREKAEQALKRAEEAEAKLSAQTGGADTEKLEEEIDKAEEELEKAIADGNTEAKQRLRRIIRAKNLQIAEARAVAHTVRGSALAVEQITYSNTVERMEAEHPELNPDLPETYNQDIVDDITELKTDFEKAGYSSSEALKKALRLVYRDTPKEKEKEKEPTETMEEKAARLASERAEKARERGLEAKGKQPTDSKETGLNSDKAGAKMTAADVTKMTSEEFNKLPAAEKKRLRGD